MSWHTKQTATHAAKALGIDPKTMVRLLRDAGHDIGQNKKFTLKQILDASQGDLEKEKTREKRARADLLEMERLEKQRDLVRLTEVQSMMTTVILPFRQRLISLPSEMASRTNPTDPVHSRAQLDQWVDQALRVIREELPKPVSEPKPKAKKPSKE